MAVTNVLQRPGFKIIGSAAFVLFVIRRLLKWLKMRKMPPGSSGVPLLGELPDYMKDTHGFFAARLSKHGGTFFTNLFFKDTVVLAPTAANLKFFKAENGIGWPKHFPEVLGHTAMAMVNGTVHKKQRTVGGRAFTPQMCDTYLPYFQELTKRHLERWAGVKEPRVMAPDIKFYTFELAQKILLGVELPEAQTRKMMELMGITIENGIGAVLPINMPGFAYSQAMHARKELVGLYQNIITAKRASPPKTPCSMIDYVMCGKDKEGGDADDVELQDFCVGMNFAGHDTTLCTMQTMLHYLSRHPEVLSQLRVEIEAAWDGIAPMSRQLFERLPKSRAFLMETMRLMPPVPFTARDLHSPATVDGYELPAGTCVILGIKSIMDHHVAADGGDPSSVNLTNWLDKDGVFTGDKQLYNFASFSIFGGGGRMCIGYRLAMDELLVFLLNLVHGYDVTVTNSEKMVFPFALWKVTAKISKREIPK